MRQDHIEVWNPALTGAGPSRSLEIRGQATRATELCVGSGPVAGYARGKLRIAALIDPDVVLRDACSQATPSKAATIAQLYVRKILVDATRLPAFSRRQLRTIGRAGGTKRSRRTVVGRPLRTAVAHCGAVGGSRPVSCARAGGCGGGGGARGAEAVVGGGGGGAARVCF